ncbi:MAG: GNAT family N-acetyltransferase [Microthrixaceae bacterium]
MTERPIDQSPGDGDGAPYPPGWEADVVLRDGGTVHVRPILPSDADRLTRFHQRQSAESIYYRYFSARPRLSKKDLHHLTHVDYLDRVAFVALLGDELVGVGRYERWGDRPVAEVAFFIDDEHGQRGLGSVLLEYLVAAARERGLHGFTASVLPDNAKMLAVFSSAGFEVSREFSDGVIEVAFDLRPNPEAAAARERREAAATTASVRRLFEPRSVAVIGAGAAPGGLGHEVLYNLITQRFGGTVWAVNERADEVAGLPASPTVLDVPGDVDLAVIATPADRVVESVEGCVRKHVGACVILTAGFSETGPEGAALEAEVISVARRGGIRVLGPNCLGLVNTEPSIRLHATFAPTAPLEGSIGILAQSGTLGAAIIDRTRRVGMGVSTFVAAGNRADIGASDLMRYWRDDERTEGVLLYLESFGRIERFLRAGRALTATKPVVAVNSGALRDAPDPETRLRQRIAAAVFRQTGIIRVGTLQQLLDIGQVMAAQGTPDGAGVAVVGNSGGAVDLTVGECRAAGLVVTHAVRLSWRAQADDYRQALEGFADDDSIHSIVVVHAPPELRPDPAVNEVILDASAASPDRVVTACNFDAADLAMLERVDADGTTVRVPVFEFPEHAARALGRLANFWAWQCMHADDDPELGVGIDAARVEALAQRLLDQHGDGTVPLGAEDALLDAAGVRLAPRRVVADVDSLAEAADDVGYPVTLKGFTRDRVLRSEAGGVTLDLFDGESVEAAAQRLLDRFGDDALPFVVQRMIDRGTDVAVVLRRQQSVTTVSVGMGGVFADEDDAALGVLPASRSDLALLVGFTPIGRGLGRTCGTDSLVTALARLAALMEAAPQVATLVVNPLIVTPTGVVAADVVVELAEPAAEGLAARRLDLDPEQ